MSTEQPLERDPDIALVRRWAAGDRAAGDILIRKYVPQLRRFFVTRIENPDDRKELIQESLLGLQGSVSRFEGRSTFKTYMFSIARNVLYTHIRKRRRADFEPMTSSFADVFGESPSSWLKLEDESRRMLEAMSQLPADDQLLLELRYWHDLSSGAIAEVLDSTNDAVRARLYRLRKRLAKLVSAGVEVADDDENLNALEQRLRCMRNDF